MNFVFSTACVASKFQVWNKPKMEFVEFHYSKSIFQKSSADQQELLTGKTTDNASPSVYIAVSYFGIVLLYWNASELESKLEIKDMKRLDVWDLTTPDVLDPYSLRQSSILKIRQSSI